MGRSALSKMTFLALRRPRETTWLPPQRFEKRLLPLGGRRRRSWLSGREPQIFVDGGKPFRAPSLARQYE